MSYMFQSRTMTKVFFTHVTSQLVTVSQANNSPQFHHVNRYKIAVLAIDMEHEEEPNPVFTEFAFFRA